MSNQKSNKVAKAYLEATSKVLTECLTGVQELAKAHLELIASLQLGSMRKSVFLLPDEEEPKEENSSDDSCGH